MNQKTKFILQRFGLMLVSLFAVITLLFVLFRLMPGDPASQLVSPRFSEADRQAILEQHGLTEPLHVQYIIYLQNVAQGNLGISFQHGSPVLPFLLNKTLNTLSITVPALLLAFTFGPFIGANFAWNRNESLDSYGTGLVLVAFAAPIFWTGMLSIMVFSFWLGWLPAAGMHSATYTEISLLDRFFSVEFLRHAILPIAIFALWRLSQPTLIMRNNMIDLIGSDFIKLKRAEGIPERSIMYRHGARNALLPLVHYMALAFGFAFGGSIILETVFSWPGVGQAMWTAVRASDYPVAQGAFTIISVAIIVLNFLVDILSVYVDPRVADTGVEA
ncbi:ABC transporter permease [Halorarum salinum]|uniref:ABC transporter permease n=1 Tax=Halorarum salinum TaxID=2743089 RepID=A0A7D5QIY9_9EURY|nr:ABC transporter permease [Halobaculum salinum]QLG61045.1 ABC transporter permease [Halobaculum salinum]